MDFEVSLNMFSASTSLFSTGGADCLVKRKPLHRKWFSYFIKCMNLYKSLHTMHADPKYKALSSM